MTVSWPEGTSLSSIVPSVGFYDYQMTGSYQASVSLGDGSPPILFDLDSSNSIIEVNGYNEGSDEGTYTYYGTINVMLPGIPYKDNGNFQLVVTLIESDGQTITSGQPVSISNVEPFVTASVVASSINPGQSTTVAFSVIDPGTDTISSWSVDWGNGYIQTLVGTATTATYTYPGLGRFSITVRPTDEDGTYRNFPVFLNQSFGVNGSVRTDFTGNSNFSSLAITQNGDFVMGGSNYMDFGESGNWDFLLAKQLATGQLDDTFGSGGTLTDPNQPYATGIQSFTNQVAIQSDGKVLLSGSSDGVPTTIRYNEDGLIDGSFGSSGRSSPFSSHFWITPRSLVIQSERIPNSEQVKEKILVAGTQYYSPSNSDFAIYRLNSDGTLDSSFGTAGKISTDVSGGNDLFSAIAVQSDGKILALGMTQKNQSSNWHPQSKFNLGLTRYNKDGLLDRTFNTTGRAILELEDMGFTDSNSQVLIQSDGRIVIVGTTLSSNNRKVLVLARYLPTGLPDASFGINGHALIDIAHGQHGSLSGISIKDALIHTDGRILVTGTSNNGSSQPFLVRIEENGIVENGGTVFLGPSGQTPIGLAVRENGELDVVLGGVNHATGNYSTHILRVLSSNDIAVVNYEPSGADKSISIVENTPYFFSPSDFGYIDISESYKLQGVSISTLPNPQEGKLQLSNNLDVMVDQFIPLRDIANLRFIPAYGMTGTNKGDFTFQVYDSS